MSADAAFLTKLAGAASGDRQAAIELLPLVYNELRRLAQSRMAHLPPGNTLQATALVHEAYMRLVGDEDPGWDTRGHFFAGGRIHAPGARRSSAAEKKIEARGRQKANGCRRL